MQVTGRSEGKGCWQVARQLMNETSLLLEEDLFGIPQECAPAQNGIAHELVVVLYGSILVILDPCNPRPAISPCWLKIKA